MPSPFMLSAVVTGITDLGALANENFSEGRGINLWGQVVGVSRPSAQFGAPHATLWTVGPAGVTVQDLGTLPGGESSEAFGINLLGQVVGLNIAGSAHHATS